MKNLIKSRYLLIVIIGIIYFVPFTGKVHLFDWDEINFAEAAREMMVTGDYLTVRIDYEPFHEKPPFFFWLQAGSMHLFGVNEFAARFPNAIIGIITLLVIFRIGKKLYDEKFGLLWVLVYLGSLLPHFYFKTGLIDPTFNLFIFLGVYFSSEYYFKHLYFKGTSPAKRRDAVFAGIFISLAILTKGPVGYLLCTLCWFVIWIMYRKKAVFPFIGFLVYSIIAAVPIMLWYAYILSQMSGTGIFEQFIGYQLRLFTTPDASHGGPFYYHFVVLFLGCFPATAFIFSGMKKQADDNVYQNNLKNWMIILLSVVLLIFSIVTTKIVHYSSMAYFPITFLAVRSLYNMIYREAEWKKHYSIIAGIIGIVLSILLIGFPIVLMNKEWILNSVTDVFTKDILGADAGWLGFEYVFGIFYLIAVILALFLIKRKRILQSVMVLFFSTAIVVFSILPFLAPRIEAYTQKPAIDFYKTLVHKDCYLYILDIGNLKYGQYFYTQKPPQLSSYINKNIPKDNFKEWLLKGQIDKPAYFITKSTRVQDYINIPGIKELYRKNGFVFMMRDKQL